MSASAQQVNQEQQKVIGPALRMECLLQAKVLEGRIESFPNMPPAVRALLDRTAKLLHEVAK